MEKKKIKATVTACALAGILTVGGIMAYFTDADTATNTFTVGKVEIDLQEPDWVPPTDITPEQEFAKDPQVKNTGKNDAYVFVEVIVPYANVITANEDGTRNDAADTELFSYDVKDGWVELEDQKVVDKTAGTVKHLYAYGTKDVMKALKSNVTTDSVFDYIKFVNVIEDEGLEGKELNVVVNAYAIQTTNITDNKDALDGDNVDGKVKPADVWSVIAAQNGDAPDFTKENEGANNDIVSEGVTTEPTEEPTEEPAN